MTRWPAASTSEGAAREGAASDVAAAAFRKSRLRNSSSLLVASIDQVALVKWRLSKASPTI
jgi:hypothetical protein